MGNKRWRDNLSVSYIYQLTFKRNYLRLKIYLKHWTTHFRAIKIYKLQYFNCILLSEKVNYYRHNTIQDSLTRPDPQLIWQDHTSQDHFCSVIDEFPV